MDKPNIFSNADPEVTENLGFWGVYTRVKGAEHYYRQAECLTERAATNFALSVVHNQGGRFAEAMRCIVANEESLLVTRAWERGASGKWEQLVL